MPEPQRASNDYSWVKTVMVLGLLGAGAYLVYEFVIKPLIAIGDAVGDAVDAAKDAVNAVVHLPVAVGEAVLRGAADINVFWLPNVLGPDKINTVGWDQLTNEAKKGNVAQKLAFCELDLHGRLDTMPEKHPGDRAAQMAISKLIYDYCASWAKNNWTGFKLTAGGWADVDKKIKAICDERGWTSGPTKFVPRQFDSQGRPVDHDILIMVDHLERAWQIYHQGI